MTTEEIIALCSFALFLFIQTAIAGYYAGKMSNRVDNTEKNINNNTVDIDSLGKKVDNNVAESFELFVTNPKCDGLNKQRDILFDALQKERGIYNEQNSKEHTALLVQGDKTNVALGKMSECLHKMQNDKECD